MNLYSATFYYPQEKDKIISQLVIQGGHVYDNLIVVNSYNDWNQKNGEKYAILYHAEKELSYEELS
jgi:hypothetical protein